MADRKIFLSELTTDDLFGLLFSLKDSADDALKVVCCEIVDRGEFRFLMSLEGIIDRSKLAAIAFSLSSLKSQESTEFLLRMVKSRQTRLQKEALDSLRIQGFFHSDIIDDIMRSRSDVVRCALARYMVVAPDECAARVLVQLLADKSLLVRESVIDTYHAKCSKAFKEIFISIVRGAEVPQEFKDFFIANSKSADQ